RGCPGLMFEDPRLDRFMAAPPKLAGARRPNQTHVTYPARAGDLILFESWLRHGVSQNRVDGERISISFNYNWD
ncbi:MAG TPA: TIGR02466 family protein, partial [Opitutaceae bacterium]